MLNMLQVDFVESTCIVRKRFKIVEHTEQSSA